MESGSLPLATRVQLASKRKKGGWGISYLVVYTRTAVDESSSLVVRSAEPSIFIDNEAPFLIDS